MYANCDTHSILHSQFKQRKAPGKKCYWFIVVCEEKQVKKIEGSANMGDTSSKTTPGSKMWDQVGGGWKREKETGRAGASWDTFLTHTFGSRKNCKKSHWANVLTSQSQKEQKSYNQMSEDKKVLVWVKQGEDVKRGKVHGKHTNNPFPSPNKIR